MITPQEALQRTIEHREIFHDEMLRVVRMMSRIVHHGHHASFSWW